MWARPLWAGLLCAALLGGCASPSAIGSSSPLRSVPAEEAFAIPDPGGPSIVSVTEQAYANAVEQRIYLATNAATPGQNELRVQLLGKMERDAGGQTSLRPGYLDDVDVGPEMRAGMPGIAMRRSPFYVQNRYGPFGYAVGTARAGAERCMFAWQTVRARGPRSIFSGDRGAARIRLRFCGEGASEERLVALMDGFTLSRHFRDAVWNPLGAPESPSPGLGRSGHALSPFDNAEEPAAEAEAPPVRVSRRQSPRRSAARPAPAASDEITAGPPPAPVGPRVPAPPGQPQAAMIQPPASRPAAPPATPLPVPVPQPQSAPAASAQPSAPRVVVPPPPLPPAP